MKIFLKHILGYNDEKILDLYSNIKQKKNNIFDDGTDKHTFTADELDALYDTIKDNNMFKLIYLLMITTGMRVGGLVKIKFEHVVNILGNTFEIKNSGRTIEKGRKWFTFMINDGVKKAMYDYISEDRLDNSEYLFPSNRTSGHISTSMVRSMIKRAGKKAGIEGDHLHPHSLRHSYAHILLDCGNEPAVVSKLLGHANVATTQSFYLKENAAEAASKANIPWLDKSNIQKKKIVPNFLKEVKPQRRKRRTIETRNGGKYDLFSSGIQLEQISE